MAEPARKPTLGVGFMEPPELLDDFPEGVAILARPVERPDGSVDWTYRPLTPEDFLNPQYGDKWLQGREHSRDTRDLAEMVERHLGHEPDVVVTSDVQVQFKSRTYKPCPDVSVIRGVRPKDIVDSIDALELGVVPCLLIEVVSPRDRRIREVDETRKVRFYARMGVPEYILVWPPVKAEQKMQLWGYRLEDRSGRYRRIEPDSQGRILSKTTGLLFAVSPEGDRIDLFDAKTGEKLLRPMEVVAAREAERAAREAAEKKAAQEAEAREAAEQKARQEAEARETAEQELERLRAELERLKR